MQSRVSSAKSVVSSMFAGSNDDGDLDEDIDAYAFALNHCFNEIKFVDKDGVKLEHPINWVPA